MYCNKTRFTNKVMASKAGLQGSKKETVLGRGVYGGFFDDTWQI